MDESSRECGYDCTKFRGTKYIESMLKEETIFDIATEAKYNIWVPNTFWKFYFFYDD